MTTEAQESGKSLKRSPLKKALRFGCFGCGGLLLCFAALVAFGILLLSTKVPKSYPGVANPIPPPPPGDAANHELDGFDSPYIGHTGSWDGKGGAMFGGSKNRALDLERSMGLRWTFMAVYWRAMEPKGPVDLDRSLPPEWKELDGFVTAAQQRGLNILMQAPVMGGNAGGPPDWAGRRERGKSAPANMAAAAEFAGKLAARYGPHGTLAKQHGWTNYGVRAWELDNEPESYRTQWKAQAADYAEFVTKVAAAIKRVDPKAVILAPAIAGGTGGLDWLEEAIHPQAPASLASAQRYSIGPPTDVVSFHCYEGLETAFSKSDRTIARDFSDIRAVFERWDSAAQKNGRAGIVEASGLDYTRKQDYWHTEGNYDFLGIMSSSRRAAWRFQFMTRAFAAGIRKVTVMDACPAEQVAVRAYVKALPNPFLMLPATHEVTVRQGGALAFKHPEPGFGYIWVLWAAANTGDAAVDVPVTQSKVDVVGVDARTNQVKAIEGKVRLTLKGDKKMAPGVLLLDLPIRVEDQKRPDTAPGVPRAK